MKKELLLYAALMTITCVLFSFEFMVNFSDNSMDISTFKSVNINSISFEMPANVFLIKGDEDKIILEASSANMSHIVLENKNGHVDLKAGNASNLLNRMRSLLYKKSAVNMYVISNDIENINIFNLDGCLANNVLYNGDRGVLKVGYSDVIQFTGLKTTTKTDLQSCVYFKENIQSISNCL